MFKLQNEIKEMLKTQPMIREMRTAFMIGLIEVVTPDHPERKNWICPIYDKSMFSLHPILKDENGQYYLADYEVASYINIPSNHNLSIAVENYNAQKAAWREKNELASRVILSQPYLFRFPESITMETFYEDKVYVGIKFTNGYIFYKKYDDQMVFVGPEGQKLIGRPDYVYPELADRKKFWNIEKVKESDGLIYILKEDGTRF